MFHHASSHLRDFTSCEERTSPKPSSGGSLTKMRGVAHTGNRFPCGLNGRESKEQAERASGHCQLNEKSLPDAFLVRKAEGVQMAKIELIVKGEN